MLQYFSKIFKRLSLLSPIINTLFANIYVLIGFQVSKSTDLPKLPQKKTGKGKEV